MSFKSCVLSRIRVLVILIDCRLYQSRCVCFFWWYTYSLVQWNWFSAVTGCTWVTCIQWCQRTNSTSPGCIIIGTAKYYQTILCCFSFSNINRFFVDGKQIKTRETAARIVLEDDNYLLYFVPWLIRSSTFQCIAMYWTWRVMARNISSSKTILAAVSLVFSNIPGRPV